MTAEQLAKINKEAARTVELLDQITAAADRAASSLEKLADTQEKLAVTQEPVDLEKLLWQTLYKELKRR